MHLVEDDLTPVLPGLAVEKRAVKGPQEQVFEHRVVRQQQVRRALLHRFTADQFVFEARLVWVALPEIVLGFLLRMTRLSDVAAERQRWDRREQRAESLQLV